MKNFYDLFIYYSYKVINKINIYNKNLPTSIILIHDWNSNFAFQIFTELMNNEKPFFFARIGGSDYDIVKNIFKHRFLLNNNLFYKNFLNTAKNYNGYFDFDSDKNQFLKYLDVLIQTYKDSDAASYCNSDMIEKFSKGYCDNFVLKNMNNKLLINYTFFEDVRPFLRSFKIWGANKKILIISPFSESILYQKNRLNKIHKNYTFPDFELITYNTSITYNNEFDTEESLNIKTRNWNDECNRMALDIELLDFDIALLSCGSYAMFLGDFIKTKMSKKAIYVGGILNVYFGIYGGRYDLPFFNDQLNLEYQIEAFENKNINQIKGGRLSNSESINAYFGKKL